MRRPFFVSERERAARGVAEKLNREVHGEYAEFAVLRHRAGGVEIHAPIGNWYAVVVWDRHVFRPVPGEVATGIRGGFIIREWARCPRPALSPPRAARTFPSPPK